MSDLYSDPKYPEYLASIEDKLAPSYLYRGVLGTGKNGRTYKIENRVSGHHYCLKTVSPEVADSAARERVRKSLAKEVAILKPLMHRCLPRIYQADTDGELPFYICSYHDGITMKELGSSGRLLAWDEAVFVVSSLIDVLEYIHEEDRAHCDLHLENILISSRVFAQGLMIIDFGSGHRDSASNEETPDRGFPFGKGAKGMARHQQVVSRAAARDEFKSYDIKAFGNALSLLARNFLGNAPYDKILNYQEFCAALQSERFGTWKEVREGFEHVLDPNVFMTKTEGLLVVRDGSRPTIALPASGPVRVGDAVLEVVNTRAFQRQRFVKQLSFCEWFYPGGTHSRFEHMLGVFAATHQCLAHMSRDPVFRARFNHTNVKGVLLAALLHDVGHYPYAHVIEHYVAARYPTDRATRESIHHFNNTIDLVKSDPELTSAIDKHWGAETREEALRILLGGLQPLSGILDGPIDCDKLDYLRRDAHHCGVPYGSGLDVQGVLKSFRCPASGDDLLFDESQVHSLEGFMVVQDQMLTAVYWHEVIRAVFAMFHRFLDAALGDQPNRLIELVGKLKKCDSEHSALETVLLPLFERGVQHGSRGELEQLVALHRTPNFKAIYRTVAKYTRYDPLPSSHRVLENVFNSVVRQPGPSATSMPISWDRVKRLRDCYRAALKEKGAAPRRYDVLVDVPWGKASNRTVNVVDDAGVIRPITEASHLAESIFVQPTAYSAPVRVFLEPSLYGRYEERMAGIRRSAEEMFYGSGVFEELD